MIALMIFNDGFNDFDLNSFIIVKGNVSKSDHGFYLAVQIIVNHIVLI
jgi:hypothetical protein